MIEREQALLREYQDKVRKARIVQVRALEKNLAFQKVHKFLEKQEERKQAVLRRLKEQWEADQKARLGALHTRCSIALRNIGSSHAAAALLRENKERSANIIGAYVCDQHRIERKRYKQALRVEHKRLEETVEARRKANKRRRTKELAACFERSIARFSSHAMMRRGKSKPAASAEIEVPRRPSNMNAYKYTFLHSNLPDAKPARSKEDAWEAANLQKQALEYDKWTREEIHQVVRRRVALRGQAAASRMLMRKRIQELERELQMVEARKQRFLFPTKSENCRRAEAATRPVEQESRMTSSSEEAATGLDEVVKFKGIPVTKEQGS